MANSMVVFSTGDREVQEWLVQEGVEAPQNAATSRPPSEEEIREILLGLDWPFEEVRHGLVWHAHATARDGRWPPFSEVNLLEEGTPAMGFRIGAMFGAFEISRLVAERCGPQVAVPDWTGRPALILPGTRYEDFHEAAFGAPPGPSADRDWRPPSTPARDHRLGQPPGGLPRARPQLLALALSGDRGYGLATVELGHLIGHNSPTTEVVWSNIPPEAPVDGDELEAIVAALVHRLEESPIPDPELVWAVGQDPASRPGLERLAARLRDRADAQEAYETAMLFLRQSPG